MLRTQLIFFTIRVYIYIKELRRALCRITHGWFKAITSKNQFCEFNRRETMVFKKYFAIAVVSFLIVNTLGAAILNRRSTDDSNNLTENTEICQNSTPCGWAVYKRYSRAIDYFMKNNCECPKEKGCIRTDDDISVAAFVYRCKIINKKDADRNS